MNVKKKTSWIRLVESVVFVLLLCVVLSGVSRLMERKASRRQFGAFLENPQQYDVLFFGDSRFVNCLFPMELWEDYGITGYNLSCYGNTMPINYWAMINALDYAEPEVVVLAVNGVRKDNKVTGSSSDLHTALDFYPLSLNKARAIEDLMDDPLAADDQGNHYADIKWEYYFTLGKYHDRWSELTMADVHVNHDVQNGADMMVGAADIQEYTIIENDRYAEESGAGFEYLRRIIEECHSRGIELLLVHLPQIASESVQMNANTVGSIAEECGVAYIDFVYLDSVVDYAADCYDNQGHINPAGGLKVTDFLGEYLQSHYALADHRQESSYANWANMLDAYAQYKRNLICKQDSLENILVMLHDDSVSAQIAIKAQADFYWDDKKINLLQNTAREHIFESDVYSMWSYALLPLEGLEDAIWEDETYLLELDRVDGVTAEYTGEDARTRAVELFEEPVWAEGKEIRIRVTDNLTGELLYDVQF